MILHTVQRKSKYRGYLKFSLCWTAFTLCFPTVCVCVCFSQTGWTDADHFDVFIVWCVCVCAVCVFALAGAASVPSEGLSLLVILFMVELICFSPGSRRPYSRPSFIHSLHLTSPVFFALRVLGRVPPSIPASYSAKVTPPFFPPSRHAYLCPSIPSPLELPSSLSWC